MWGCGNRVEGGKEGKCHGGVVLEMAMPHSGGRETDFCDVEATIDQHTEFRPAKAT